MVNKSSNGLPSATRGLIPLPEGNVPEDTQCVSICIPNDPAYKRQLYAGLYVFTHWTSYERDDIHKATLVAQAWRKAILEGMLNCYQFKLRNGVPAYSTDGGETWTDVPSEVGGEENGHDPREIEPTLPARTGTNAACLSAANAVACYVELHRQLSNWYSQIGFILDMYYAIGSSLMKFFPQSWSTMGLNVDQAQVALAILEHSASLNMDAFTSAIQEKLTCILYCNADEYGQWNAAAFSAALAEMSLESGDMWRLLEDYLSYVSGVTGLNNAGVTNSVSTYDCEDCSCTWCLAFDFSASANGWTGEYGTYWTGGGWIDGNQPDGMYIYKTGLESMDITRIEWCFNEVWSGNSPGLFMSRQHPIENYFAINTTSGAMCIGQNCNETGVTVLSVAADKWLGDIQHFGTTRLTAIKIYGKGTPPVGAGNC